MIKSYKILISTLCLSWLTLGCSEKKSATQELDTRVSPEYQGPSEPTYCDDTTTYSGGITVTGEAKFVVRPVITSGLSAGLGAADTSNPKPIRYAEVRILNSSGTVVQCAETDVNGDFSFRLPNDSKSYTIHIMARASNAKLKISVLDSPEFNTIYSAQKSITANATQSVTITAQATGQIVSGAFNIYDQILNVNEYIRSEVSSSFVASKVQAYWKPGFNPGDYVGSGPISFYYPGFDRLFILGGDNGDTDYSDTDHFDNSIIVHEYGHFLEDNYAVSNSPGGSHSGNKQIDARLAWSEGFANFLNAAVRTYISGDANDANYVDTIGNATGNTDISIYVDIESYEGCLICDIPDENGEGIFREFAITRYLYDAIDNTPTETDIVGNWNANSNSPHLEDGEGREGDTYRVSVGAVRNLGSGNIAFLAGDLVYYDGSVWLKNDAATVFDNISGKFSEIWSALTSSSGFKSGDTSFRDVGLLNLIQHNGGSSDWASLRIFHGMPNDTTTDKELRREYSYQIDTTANGASSCSGQNFTIYPLPESESYSDSNLFRNNEFFYLQHNGGNLTVTLKYTTASGTEANLDLYIYGSEGAFGYEYGEFPYYSISYPTGSSGDVETVTVNMGTQSAGDFLINVNALGGVGNTTTFELRSGSGKLCPKNINL